MPVLFAYAVGLLWACGCIALDRRNARIEQLPPIRRYEAALVLLAACVAGTIAPAENRLAVTIAAGALACTAFGDLRHLHIWEEISVPTLFLVCGARLLSNGPADALGGIFVLGSIAAAMYFGAHVMLRRESGFGDVVPMAIVGGALGVESGLLAFCIASLLSSALMFKRIRGGLREIPFGPALAMMVVIGSALLAAFPSMRT